MKVETQYLSMQRRRSTFDSFMYIYGYLCQGYVSLFLGFVENLLNHAEVSLLNASSNSVQVR